MPAGDPLSDFSLVAMSSRVVFAEVPHFYAAVERAGDPALSERPVIVGGNPRKRGLVQSATPDALARGVTLDMPVSEALEGCSSLGLGLLHGPPCEHRARPRQGALSEFHDYLTAASPRQFVVAPGNP